MGDTTAKRKPVHLADLRTRSEELPYFRSISCGTHDVPDSVRIEFTKLQRGSMTLKAAANVLTLVQCYSVHLPTEQVPDL